MYAIGNVFKAVVRAVSCGLETEAAGDRWQSWSSERKVMSSDAIRRMFGDEAQGEEAADADVSRRMAMLEPTGRNVYCH